MAFPTTLLLDSFVRPNQSPIGSGWLGPTRPAPDADQLKVASNQLAGISSPSNSNHSYWATSFARDQEGWIFVPVLPDSGQGISITARIENPSTAGVSFYQWTYTTDTGWRTFVVTGDSYDLIGTPVATPVMAPGDGIGFQLQGNELRGFHFNGTSWNLIATTVDSTLNSPGFIGVEMTDTSPRGSNFGGGVFGSIVSGVVAFPPYIGGRGSA